MKKKFKLLIIVCLLIMPIKGYADIVQVDDIKDVSLPYRFKDKVLIYSNSMLKPNLLIEINNEYADILVKKESDDQTDIEYHYKKDDFASGTSEVLDGGENGLIILKYRNAGYYYLNGQKKAIDLKIVINKLEIYHGENFGVTDKYSMENGIEMGNTNVVTIKPEYFLLNVVDKKGIDSQVRSTSRGYSGIHYTMTFKITDSGQEELDEIVKNNMIVPWMIRDVDMYDSTITETLKYKKNETEFYDYVESIQFGNGFDDSFYVQDGTVLNNIGRRFRATEITNDYDTTSASHNESYKDDVYSTVIAYQNEPSVKVEWWGSDCHSRYNVGFMSATEDITINPKTGILEIQNIIFIVLGLSIVAIGVYFIKIRKNSIKI